MNLGDAKTKAIKLINEYSTNNVLNSASANGDYSRRFNDLADMAQKEIATIKKINASYTISQNPLPNQLGIYAFDLIQHLDSDNVQSAAMGSKSYYFEVDRQCTVYIEESVNGVWTILKTITVPNTVTSFTSYKGLITPSSASNSVRIRFSGSYPYNIRNRALYAYTFPTDNDVQVFRPYVKYDMPTDFMELRKIVNETDPRQYVSLTDYKTEGKRTIIFNYYLTGSFRVEYYRYPTAINNDTNDTDYTFDLDIEAQELIPYYMAAHILMDEDPSRSTVLFNLYQSKLSNLSNNDHNNSNTVSNAMGW